MSDAGKPSLLAGFKEFVMRGNVIDLAVAVVIGAAFSSVVNSVVNGIINPLVGAFGTKDLAGYSSCLKGPCVANEKGEVTSGIHILWGSVLSAALTFLITAAVVYFLMVLPMARYLARRAARQQPVEVVEPVKEEVEEIALLRDIRDALVAPRSGGAG
ncbi:large conductance mechanosensitive channel protein MscL [Actinacidiphila bryophytorum]|uniref:large conductance mechanosensitive channel protein MscL n=1 Tax=Actinacidiphila bryophytorum TaxID=1436133 RepID=UPI002176C9CD|nr:large conductance mechanosensitive channel protein MscL [Actinacidiphila bryophytorum]UWE08040.1 large conductance mechanosensitive channel protein MscL [Actinacidiphila bryophytorum]